MATWAERRKITYLTVFIVLFAFVSTYIYIRYFKTPPTCFDGWANGDELGVDCGGSCQLLCPADNIPPIVEWSRSFELAPGRYSLFALVENPNINAIARAATYTFSVFDAENNIIAQKQGTTVIPAGVKFGILEPGIEIEGIPARVQFAFNSISFEKNTDTRQSQLRVSGIRMAEETPSAKVEGFVENVSVNDIRNVEVAAIVYGEDGNAVGVSKTLVDLIPAGGSKRVVFTWNSSFESIARACEIPTDTMLLIDRSGSMDDEKINPPEPISTVLDAARQYVQKIGEQGKIGIASFAGTATIDQPITSIRSEALQALDMVRIGTDGIQHTNIASALDAARAEFSSQNILGNDSDKIAILLTDGVTTRPLNPKNATDMAYAKQAAEIAAAELKVTGAHVFSIGLGREVDISLLKIIASDEASYYAAPTAQSVAGIYDRIASRICVQSPVIQLIPRILP
ncbi:MAG TPA: VWA domain-containing protein [Candidatus Paceibacterota bacterium]|nr:VWA domain-containing protein [Candidatus Paceibacterota bacterium]